MKILLVSIPNHHFFQWANQLRESGYDVYWFDVTDGAGFVDKIKWVKQYNGWKLEWNYPFRYTLKKKAPKLYRLLERVTTNKIEVVFDKILKEVQPDIVHCFEMKLAGLPIFSVMQQNKIPFVYSSWGSDIYDYEGLGVSKIEIRSFLKRVDYLITDCERDFKIAKTLGFNTKFLGVFPGNGGIDIDSTFIKSVVTRKTICIKGYDDGVGKALVVLKAIERIELDKSIDFLIFSADQNVEHYIKNSNYFKHRNVEVISRSTFISNKLLLQKLGFCLVYIGNSSSDGMPNSLLEAMGMGVFPIQSNPGGATAEIILNGVNGYLIENPDDVSEIVNHINNSLENKLLLENAAIQNRKFIADNYNRNQFKDKIVSLYKEIK